ncbi:MAG: manganese efflux pump [Ruminococcaceae bacterium]|nr:manganese efflux pump [Oscillospiraceae bacterium]
MNLGASFLIKSLALGVGLAMDAFSVSLANGLNEPRMKVSKMCGVAGVFALFQALMPLLGWICVHTISQMFSSFEVLIPWIALALLLFIGGKMLVEGIRGGEEENEVKAVGFAGLLVQGVATSIDALSVGFTIADYDFSGAFLCALLIALVTFILCMIGLKIGKCCGTRLAGKASILGGVILILIGIEIFLSGMFG